MEIRSDRVSGPIVIHRVSWEGVSPDAVLGVLFLVIVDEELFVAVAVEIDQSNVICAEDGSVIDDLALDEATIAG